METIVTSVINPQEKKGGFAAEVSLFDPGRWLWKQTCVNLEAWPGMWLCL